MVQRDIPQVLVHLNHWFLSPVNLRLHDVMNSLQRSCNLRSSLVLFIILDGASQHGLARQINENMDERGRFGVTYCPQREDKGTQDTGLPFPYFILLL